MEFCHGTRKRSLLSFFVFYVIIVSEEKGCAAHVRAALIAREGLPDMISGKYYRIYTNRCWQFQTQMVI